VWKKKKKEGGQSYTQCVDQERKREKQMIAVPGKKKHMWRGTRESKPYLLLFRNLPSSLDQGRQRTQRLGELEERMLEQFRRCRSFLCVNLERLGEVVCKHLREILRVGDLWRAVGGDEVECLERVLVQVGRLAFDHLCVQNVRRSRERKVNTDQWP
jgi:hypothetical protein